MTEQEVIAARLLKVMSAQHHGVHRNSQSTAQNTYQVCIRKILFRGNNEYKSYLLYFNLNSLQQF